MDYLLIDWLSIDQGSDWLADWLIDALLIINLVDRMMVDENDESYRYLWELMIRGVNEYWFIRLIDDDFDDEIRLCQHHHHNRKNEKKKKKKKEKNPRESKN